MEKNDYILYSLIGSMCVNVILFYLVYQRPTLMDQIHNLYSDNQSTYNTIQEIKKTLNGKNK